MPKQGCLQRRVEESALSAFSNTSRAKRVTGTKHSCGDFSFCTNGCSGDSLPLAHDRPILRAPAGKGLRAD
jgi:hypothetical protein